MVDHYDERGNKLPKKRRSVKSMTAANARTRTKLAIKTAKLEAIEQMIQSGWRPRE